MKSLGFFKKHSVATFKIEGGPFGAIENFSEKIQFIRGHNRLKAKKMKGGPVSLVQFCMLRQIRQQQL